MFSVEPIADFSFCYTSSLKTNKLDGTVQVDSETILILACFVFNAEDNGKEPYKPLLTDETVVTDAFLGHLRGKLSHILCMNNKNDDDDDDDDE